MRAQAAILVMLCCLLAACSITKRHYRKGFHIEWRNHTPVQPVAEQLPGYITGKEYTQHAGPLPADSIFAVDNVHAPVPHSNVVPQKAHAPKPARAVNIYKRRASPVMAQPVKTPVPVDNPGEQEMARRYAKQSLAFGICSIILFFFFFILAPFLAVAAIRRGRMALRFNSGPDPAVARRARTGILIGQIVLVLIMVLAIAFLVLAISLLLSLNAGAGLTAAALVLVMFLCIIAVFLAIGAFMLFSRYV